MFPEIQYHHFYPLLSKYTGKYDQCRAYKEDILVKALPIYLCYRARKFIENKKCIRQFIKELSKCLIIVNVIYFNEPDVPFTLQLCHYVSLHNIRHDIVQQPLQFPTSIIFFLWSRYSFSLHLFGLSHLFGSFFFQIYNLITSHYIV